MPTQQTKAPAVFLPTILADIVESTPATPAPIPVIAKHFGWDDLHPKSGLRLALHGSHGVRLQTLKVGRQRLTTPAAFARFLVEREAAAVRERDQHATGGLLLDHVAAGQVLAAREPQRRGVGARR